VHESIHKIWYVASKPTLPYSQRLEEHSLCAENSKGGEPMKNAIFVLLAALALALAFAFGLYVQAQKMTTAHPAPDDAIRNLTLQKTCAEGAAAYYKSEKLGGPRQTSDYYNHYDATRGKCFILTETADFSSSGHTSTYATLNDAFDATSYGSIYLDRHTTDPLKGSVPVCVMVPDGLHSKNCHSDEEWKSYVATFGVKTGK